MSRNHRIDTLKFPSSSASTLSAQFFAKSQPNSRLLAENLSLVLNMKLSNDLPVICLIVIDLLTFHGLRISEILSIQKKDILTTGHIFIKGSKGSENRIILPVMSKDFINQSFISLLPLSNVYSRFYFYRQFKKYGIYQRFKANRNYSVTHYFRHRLLEFLKQNEISESDLSNFIGHKSKKSITHYV